MKELANIYVPGINFYFKYHINIKIIYHIKNHLLKCTQSKEIQYLINNATMIIKRFQRII